MKGIKIDAYGDNSEIKYSESLEKPKIKESNELLIQVYSAAINPHDVSIRKGEASLVFPYPLPNLIMGYDFAGIVVEIGKDVKKFQIGDKVYSCGQIGAFSEFMVVPEYAIALIPKNLTFDEAASIPMVGLTTTQAFSDFKPQKDSKVLITGGAGGIGTFAIQYVANILNCEVTTTASDQKIELCKGLGAKKVINYKKEDFTKTLSGYDFAYDTTSESVSCFTILKPKGIVRSISTIPDASIIYQLQDLGLKGQSFAAPHLLNVLSSKNRLLAWYYDVDYKSILMYPSGDQLSKIAQWIEEGKIKPVIDKIFELKDTKDAFAYMESKKATGKVVIHIKDHTEK